MKRGTWLAVVMSSFIGLLISANAYAAEATIPQCDKSSKVGALVSSVDGVGLFEVICEDTEAICTLKNSDISVKNVCKGAPDVSCLKSDKGKACDVNPKGVYEVTATCVYNNGTSIKIYNYENDPVGMDCTMNTQYGSIRRMKNEKAQEEEQRKNDEKLKVEICKCDAEGLASGIQKLGIMDKSDCLERIKKDMDKAKNQDKCAEVMDSVEQEIKRYVTVLETSITNINVELLQKGISKETRDGLMATKVAKMNEKQSLGVTGMSDDRIQTFEDYPNFFAKFNAGVDYNTVDDIFEETNFRLGLLVSQKFKSFSLLTQYRSALTKDKETGFYFPNVAYLSFSSTLTTIPGLLNSGSADNNSQGTANTQADAATTAQTDPKAKKALSGDLQLFVPFYLNPILVDNKKSRIGYVLSYGGIIVDDEDKQHSLLRYGHGIRFAFNPEMYSEVLFMHSEEYGDQYKDRSRVLIKGQMPVTSDDPRNRLYLGGSVNFPHHRYHSDKDRTVVNVYLYYNVDFLSVYNFFSDNKDKK